MEKKTIKEWLEMMKEPYKSQALINLSPSQIDRTVGSISVALYIGFTWRETPEGHDYWMGIHIQSSITPEKYLDSSFNEPNHEIF